MIEKQKELHMKTNHRKWIGLGYLIIFMLIGIIGYSWYCEWDEVEKLEVQNRQIDEFRKKINKIYIQFTELSSCFRHFFLLVFFLADYQQISILNFGDLGNAT